MKKNLEEVEAERQKIVDKAKALEERERQEEELRIRAEKAAYKTLEEIISSEPKTVEVYVLALDCKIKIQPITVEDYIKSLKFREDRTEVGATNYFVHMLTSTWGRCDPTVTDERLRKMSLSTLVKIMSAIPIPKMDVSQDPLSRQRSRLPRVPPRAARTS